MLTAAFFISSVMFYSIIFKVLIKSVNSVFKFLLSFIRRIFLLCKIGSAYLQREKTNIY